MPPIRTNSTALPSKPVKTERTHEENQERAYIAASRRSDRSLEARIESARRASEIHKKRTGRALRVTEQDVINEEMYEEEDDDLPSQYRRILQSIPVTGDGGFNRKMQAWLLAQHATRAALFQQEHGINNLWAQHYPNAPQFAHQMMPQQFAPQMMPPQAMPQSPQNFRHQPYPMAGQGYRPQHHQSTSIASPEDITGVASPYPTATGVAAAATEVQIKLEEQRRMSMPAVSLGAAPQSQQQTAGATRPSVSRSPSLQTAGFESMGQQGLQQSQASTPQPSTPQLHSPQMAQTYQYPFRMTQTPIMQDPMTQYFGPFSPTMPLDAQQLFGYDTMSPYNQQFMAANPTLQTATTPFYSYNPNMNSSNSKPKKVSQAQEGLNQTLVPSTLDTTMSKVAPAWSNPPSATSAITSAKDSVISPFTPFPYGFDSDMPEMTKGVELPQNGTCGSGTATPNEVQWDHFLSSWTNDDQLAMPT